jgi:hypothetical protein
MRLERLTDQERLSPGRLIYGLKAEDLHHLLRDALRHEGIIANDAQTPPRRLSLSNGTVATEATT